MKQVEQFQNKVPWSKLHQSMKITKLLPNLCFVKHQTSFKNNDYVKTSMVRTEHISMAWCHHESSLLLLRAKVKGKELAKYAVESTAPPLRNKPQNWSQS